MSLQLVKNNSGIGIESFSYTGVPYEWNPGGTDNSVKYGVFPVELFDIATSPAAMAFNKEIRSAEKTIGDWASKVVALKARTPLGKKLLSLRAKNIAHGEPLLSWEEIDNYERFSEEILEHDIVVKMPPKRKFTVKAQIRCVKKAEPKIVTPEHPYFEI